MVMRLVYTKQIALCIKPYMIS